MNKMTYAMVGVVIAAVALALAMGGESSPSAPPNGPADTVLRSVPPQAEFEDKFTISSSALDDAIDYPPILITMRTEVVRVADGQVTTVGHVQGVAAGLAVGDGTGIVLVEVLHVGESNPTEIVIFNGESRSIDLPTPAENVRLYDLVHLGGIPHALYGLLPAGLVEPHGSVILHNLDDGTATEVAPAFMAEFLVSSASVAGGTLVTSAYADLTESITFFDLAGTRIESRPSPTDTLAYNAPPLIFEAHLSPDGSQLAYFEGPDWDGLTSETVGHWELVIADLAGIERRIPVAGKDREVTRLDFDGRWALVSSRTIAGPQSPLLIDTSVDPAVGYELQDVKGDATFDISVDA